MVTLAAAVSMLALCVPPLGILPVLGPLRPGISLSKSGRDWSGAGSPSGCDASDAATAARDRMRSRGQGHSAA
jgi:hypothetical protein